MRLRKQEFDVAIKKVQSSKFNGEDEYEVGLTRAARFGRVVDDKRDALLYQISTSSSK